MVLELDQRTVLFVEEDVHYSFEKGLGAKQCPHIERLLKVTLNFGHHSVGSLKLPPSCCIEAKRAQNSTLNRCNGPGILHHFTLIKHGLWIVSQWA